VKLKNGEIFSAVDALGKLTPVGTKFPVKVSLAIVKLSTKLADPYREIEEVRQGLFKTYGEVDPENPQQIKVDPKGEKYPKFISELNELFDQEVEIVFEKVKLPEKVAATCDKCNHNMDKQFEIEPVILMALEKFVEV